MDMTEWDSLFESIAIGPTIQTVESIAQAIEEWKRKIPEGKRLVTTMRTADGRVMDVHTLKAIGRDAFLAEGNIEGLQCGIVGHISLLVIFCSFEDSGY